MLTTMAFDHCRRRWFGTCSCKPVPRGLPSSVEQLHTSRPLRPSLRSWRTIVGITAKAQPASLQFPIQRIQVEIRQQRRQRPALRRALLASNHHPRRHHPGPQIPSDQPQHSLVPNHFRDPLHQNVMVDVVEELRDINIHHPVLARADVSLRRSYGVVRAAPRTKTVARLAEPRIENRLQHLQQCLLYHPIHHRRYTELTRPPVRLRDVHPPYRARRPSPGHEFRPHLRAVALPMNFEFVDGHPIDPRRAPVAFDRRPRPPTSAASTLMSMLGCRVARASGPRRRPPGRVCRQEYRHGQVWGPALRDMVDPSQGFPCHTTGHGGHVPRRFGRVTRLEAAASRARPSESK